MNLLFSFFKSLPEKEKILTLATKITITRILLVPVIVLSMVKHNWDMACLLILIASISDLLDGMLARARNEKTILGSILDPIADKLFIISCYLAFGFGHSPVFILPGWFTFLVLIKELSLIVGGFLICYFKGWIEMKPTLLGKATMQMHIFFILWLFASYFFGWVFPMIFNFWIYFILILVLSSLVQYAKLAIRNFYFQGQI